MDFPVSVSIKARRASTVRVSLLCDLLVCIVKNHAETLASVSFSICFASFVLFLSVY